MAVFAPLVFQAIRWVATRQLARMAVARTGAAGFSRVAATPVVNPFLNPATRAVLPAAPLRAARYAGVRFGGAPAAGLNPNTVYNLARFGPIQNTVQVANRVPLWARAGGRVNTARNFVANARPISAVGRAVAPNLAARFQAPTASLAQRVAAKPTLMGKAATVGFAPVRATVRGVNQMAVPGAIGAAEQSLIWSPVYGAIRRPGQREERARQEIIATGENYQGPDAEEPTFTIPFDAEFREGIPESYQGPISPDLYEPGVIGPAPSAPAAPPAPSAPTLLPDGSFETQPGPGTRPAPTVPTTPQDSGVSEFEQARQDYERDLAGLNAGYQNMLNQVRSMYQLSETEEEKQQLRFTLADLEAQFEAGKEAIANLYVEKTQTIQALAAASRARTREAAIEASGVYSQAAVDLAALQAADNAAQVAANRGLGIGEIRQSPYAGLLETMAPIAGQYAQRVGDISAEGLEYLGALNESMGAARQGELQSLYASSAATAGIDHARRVAERIAAERLAMASAVQSMMGQQLSMQQSMAGRRPEASDFERFTASDINSRIEQMATRTFNSPQNFANMFASEFGRAPTEAEWAYWENDAAFYRDQNAFDLALQDAQLAELQRTNAERAMEQLYGLLPADMPRTEESLRQAGILPSE